jgi:hypothetical protein
MALTDPPASLDRQPLPLIPVKGTLCRISHPKFADPVYWSHRGLYRFDSPAAKYGVLYTGRTFALFSTSSAIDTVTVIRRYPLLDHPHLFRLLQSYRVAVI